MYTTTDLTADQIDQLGLDNVARIHREIQDVMGRVDFKGSLQDFFRFMRTDARFYASNDQAGRDRYLAETEKAKAAVSAEAAGVVQRAAAGPADGQAGRAVPEKSAGKAFYQSPAPDGSRPGT